MEGCRNNTPKVVPVAVDGCPILFRKIEIPASLGDENTDPPVPGRYRNVLIVYKATNATYLYSSDGMPTRIDGMGDTKEIWDALHDEEDARKDADDEIWTEIEAIEASSDVVDVVGTYAELQQYDTSKLKNNDIIKVLQDETRDDAITYYRWNGTAFTYVGAEGPYYTASETDTLLAGKQDKLIAGANIQIASDGKTISATDTTYSAGTGISIDANNVISSTATVTLYNATGQNTDGAMTQKATTDALALKANSSSLATVATSGDYNDLSNKPVIPTMPTKTSQLINDGAGGSSAYVEFSNLALVATSGNYNDLSNKPTIPAAQVNSDWNAVSGVAQILNKPTLATVATSGSYNDLTDKPTIPATNNISSTDWNGLWQ